MERSPLFLAALARAAVPGLDPTSVEALPSESGQLFDVAFVQDSDHRRWVVRAPRTEAAGAQMEATVALLGLLSRRLPFALPSPRGFVALKGGGRAAVYPYLPGQPIDFAALPAGPGLSGGLGRAIAAIHGCDHRLFEEAGVPGYDADTYRGRHLADLDRAAATGQVPPGLLSRWERLLEDVTLWRFAPTPTHGDLTGDQVLVIFDDDRDVATGRVAGVTGWDDAKVADPADDFAGLASQAPPRALETVLEAYSQARDERPDAHLLTRAALVAEMREASALLTAMAAGDQELAQRQAAVLRGLDERLAGQSVPEHSAGPRTGPARPRAVPLPAPEESRADEPAETPQERPGEDAAVAPEAAPEESPEQAGAAPPSRPPVTADGPDPGPEFEPGYRPT